MNAQRLHNVKITTPRLILLVPNSTQIEELAGVLTSGIQPPDKPHFMEDALYGKSLEENTKGLKQFVNKSINEWNKDDWHIPFAAFYKGKPIGLVTIFSHHFPITKSFGCSYWIGLDYQGKGFGTEAFQGVLSFGFDGLLAQEAYAGAYADNIPSVRLMEKLGFIFNGEYWMARQGEAIKDKRMRLPKEKWETPHGIIFEGMGELKDLFIYV